MGKSTMNILIDLAGAALVVLLPYITAAIKESICKDEEEIMIP